MVSIDKIRNKLRVITACQDKLEQLKTYSEEEFLSDFRLTDSARHNLQISIEAMLDICNHLIARHSLEIPQSNAETFAVLCRHGFLNPKMQSTYSAMARFRNRIVHMYDDVNNREIYLIVQQHLKDYHRFIDDIVRQFGSR
ncbi:MAG: hypothetical protein DDT30_01599 [Dehalococcoidia bacterium]|nr:hypothetical protein [Bacillota bacterium]